MTGYRPLPVVLAENLLITPCPLTHDRLGRPIVGPCLVWTRAKDRKGYGVIGNKDFGDAKIRRVHRVMYGLFNGLTLDAFGELDHLCRVKECAAPAHLEETSHAENLNRGGWGDQWRRQRDKTHCPKGHPYDETNTIRPSRGGRICRTCHRTVSRTAYWDNRKQPELP